MGLTIHYGLKSTTKSDKCAKKLVEDMRQLALDLPFEEVSEIVVLNGDECDYEKHQDNVDNPNRWLIIQSNQYVSLPWNENSSICVRPLSVIAFEAVPGPGSEPANIGLCQYPATIEVTYRPSHDTKFKKDGQFSWELWQRWLCRNGHDKYLSPTDEQFIQTRKIRTKLGNWSWSSFCKTQYASDPSCGGIPNFLRCHVSVITLLDRIAKLPKLEVEINDEGKYGESNYSDDWREAREAGREPTYVPHKGKYDVKALADEVGDWNQMVAAFAGAMKDAVGATGLKCESAIGSFSNFEQLEFKGSQDERIAPFLQTMKTLSEHIVQKVEK